MRFERGNLLGRPPPQEIFARLLHRGVLIGNPTSYVGRSFVGRQIDKPMLKKFLSGGGGTTTR